MSIAGSVLFALAGVVGATQVLAARREARAAKLTPPRGHDVEVDGRRMHVEVLGEAGPDLVLIHGSSGNARDFTFRFAGELAARYRVLVVDRPGFGWSDPHPEAAALEVQARVIQEAVVELGAVRPIVLGQSYGGAVALAWAATRPDTVSAVVTVSGVAYPWETGLGLYYSLLSHPLGQAILIPLITAFVPRAVIRRKIDEVFAPQRAPRDFAEHFGSDMAVRRGQMRENARQRRALLDEIIRLSPLWAGIALPIEVIHGDADRIVHPAIHAERLTKENPNARLTLLPGIGHMPHHVSGEEVIAAIDRAALRANVK
jgi:pimeloyl-ACP methyl ester carboxylesterase